jgi:hypothetical protein
MVRLSSATNARPGCASTRSRSRFNSRSVARFPSAGSYARGSRKMSTSSENLSIRFQPFERLVPPLKMARSPAASETARSASVT